jgi:hypothetical protein
MHRLPCTTLLLILTTLTAAIATPVTVRSAPAQSVPAAVPATPENAAPFLGDWTLTGNGPNGEATFTLTVRADAGKLVGEISGPQMPRHAISDISKAAVALLIAFNFDYQGNPVPVAVTLTPADGKVGLHMDFAGGAYVLEGGATKASPKPQP